MITVRRVYTMRAIFWRAGTYQKGKPWLHIKNNEKNLAYARGLRHVRRLTFVMQPDA